MNFFEAQDRSRWTTRWLVVLFLLATLAIIAAVTIIVAAAVAMAQPLGMQSLVAIDWVTANAALLSGVAGGTAGFIGLASLYRTARLSSGGGRVARELGGTLVPTDVRDTLRLRLRNVVEEMSIASGVPVPEIYVLEEEAGINAFAAGFNTGDAAVAVTRGTLELLDRDELQGVIAHEFSHILNGDMRLNIRLMGILFGILAIGLAGRMILRGTRHVRLTGGRSGRGGAPVVLVLGLGLFVVGSIGVVFARLIKAGVSRQREYLADASAVQFTRQSNGIAGALKKIAASTAGSRIREADPEEISHMLFALGGSSLTGLLATHPPIEKRILALDPSFEADQLDAIRVPSPDEYRPDRAGVSALAGNTPADTAVMLDAERIAASVGNPGEQHVAFAGKLRRSVPESLYRSAHSRHRVIHLVLAMILHEDETRRARQLAMLRQRLGERRTAEIESLYDGFASLGPLYRLPLLEIAFPALKDRPAAELGFLVKLVHELAGMDGRLDFYEYCFTRTLLGHLSEAVAPSAEASHRARDLGGKDLRGAVQTLLLVLACEGASSEAAAHAAYEAGISTLDGRWPPFRPITNWLSSLDSALELLRHLSGRARRRLLIAVISTIRHDRRTTLAEAELLGVICAMLDCPLPPLASDVISVEHAGRA